MFDIHAYFFLISRASQSRTWMYTRSTWYPCRCSTLKVQVPAPRSSSWLTKAVSTIEKSLFSRKSVTITKFRRSNFSSEHYNFCSEPFFMCFAFIKARGLKWYAHSRILHKFWVALALDIMCECEIVLSARENDTANSWRRPNLRAADFYGPNYELEEKSTFFALASAGCPPLWIV